MNRSKVFLLIIILILLSFPIYSEQEFMEIDQIKPGMKGYGKSVFSGTKVETFSATIISVMKDFSPGHDVILVKLSGNEIVENAGVISGMSGSPIYIDGKLIGAVAYSWSFSKEPIAGVTPIMEMLDLKKKFLDSKQPGFGIFGMDMDKEGLNYIQTPVTLTGFNQHGFQEFKKEFSQFGFYPVQGGGVGIGDISITTLEPGSPVAVQLIKGDMDISAIGTVTHVDGDEVYAFGHPMLNGGNIRLPMATAYIHTVLPSIYRSFKMGSSVTTIGEFVQDRTPGVYGKIGRKPDYVNLKFLINEKEFNVDIINNKYLLGTLLRTAIFNLAISALGDFGELFIKYEIKIYSDSKELIKYSDLMSVTNIFDLLGGISRMLRVFTFTKNNPEKDIPISNIIIKFKVSDKASRFFIKDIVLNRNRFSIGEEIKIKLLLKELKKPVVEKVIKFSIPTRIVPGNYYLLISDSYNEDKQRLIESPNYNYLNSFDEIKDWIAGSISLNKLSVRLIKGEIGLNVDDMEFIDVTPTFFLLQQGSPSHQGLITTQRTIKKQIFEFQYPVLGSKQFVIQIKNEMEKR